MHHQAVRAEGSPTHLPGRPKRFPWRTPSANSEPSTPSARTSSTGTSRSSASGSRPRRRRRRTTHWMDLSPPSTAMCGLRSAPTCRNPPSSTSSKTA